MVTYPHITRLIDSFIVEFNTGIVQSLTWLNNPLGRLQELSRNLDGGLVRVPAAHTINGEYIDLLPDDTLTNYSWFDFDPIEFKSFRIPAKFKARGTWKLFLDLNSIYENKDPRYLENVKYEIVNALGSLTLKTGAFRGGSISERIQDVYKGFSITNVQDRYFMQPYAALNVSFEAYIRNQVCGVENTELVTADSVETVDNPNIDASGLYRL